MTNNTPAIIKPKFPQAGVGCGGIFFRQTGPRTVRVLLASRAENVGRGSGISFGGWKELADVLKLPEGAFITAEASASREGWEEIPGLFSVIPEAELELNMQYLFNASVHKPNDPYGNTIHDGIFFGIVLKDDAEEQALCNLPKSRETSAPLRPFDLAWTQPDAADMTGLPSDFHHAHEVEAFRALCWRLEHRLLRTERLAA